MLGDGGYYGDGAYDGDHPLELESPLTLEAEVADETVFKMRQNDTRPSFLRQMKDANGNPVNLTLCTGVKLIMEDLAGTEKVNAAAVIEDAASGWVRYDWSAGDTDTVGGYLAEFQATMVDGEILTAPTERAYKIKVRQELGS